MNRLRSQNTAQAPIRHRSKYMPEYQTGQVWGALRKAWKGYRIAKVQGDNARMREYATRIRTLQGQLGVPQASFPNVGL